MNYEHIEDIYPLSPMQQGMLFHTLYAPGQGVYITQSTGRLRGRLNFHAFQSAWQQVIDRHPALRTAFVWEDVEEPLQVVCRGVTLPVTHLDWRALSGEHQQKDLEELLQAERESDFDLSQAPLMRLTLIQLADDLYQFIWSYHHILLDGWSLSLLMHEFFTSYGALCQGQEPNLPMGPVYRNYIGWLQQQNASDTEEFWRRQLKGFTTPTVVYNSSSHERVSGSRKGQRELQTRLSKKTTSELQRVAQQNGLTINTIVQGMLALLLNFYSGEDDVMFGAVVSGRPAALPDVESMIGLFINALPVRIQVSHHLSLLNWLKQLQAQQTALRDHEYCPLVQIHGWSDVPKDQPLFDILYVFENYPRQIDTNGGGIEQSHTDQEGTPNIALQIEEYQVFEGDSYPLAVASAPGDELPIKIGYDSERFDDAQIEQILTHLCYLLQQVAQDPEQQLAQLNLLTKSERQQILVDFNDSAADYPGDQTVHQLFSQQAVECPGQPAVISDEQTLSFAELEFRSDQLARLLLSRGIGVETPVGVCMEHSVETVVAILAILKAGGAFVPLGSTAPSDRLAFMVRDSGMPLLLTQEYLDLSWPEEVLDIIYIDRAWEGGAEADERESAVETAPDALAYVLYTSGSTGRPKGVMVEHRSLVNYLHWFNQHLFPQMGHSLPVTTKLTFDACFKQLLAPLLRGDAVWIVPREVVGQPAEFLRRLNEHEATGINCVPSMWLAILDELTTTGAEVATNLRSLLVGGKHVPHALLEATAERLPHLRIWNLYGPTEATANASAGRLTAGDIPTIGRPIANTQLYVLNRELQPVVQGQPGELYVGGVGVARGYLNRPALTAERFVPNPFCDQPGARLYRTGDLVRWTSSGELEFLGRLDHQVKIRGYRIELGEIETALLQHPNIQRAVVDVRGEASEEDVMEERRLVAYIVGSGDEWIPDTSDLRRFLRRTLPDYMIPAIYVSLREVPLMLNGKVDRKALPAPEQMQNGFAQGFVPPRNHWELQLTRIWEDVLKRKPIGVTDYFFDIGGHSLLAVRLMAQIKQVFDRELPLATLFQATTIEQFAQILQQEGDLVRETLVPIQPHGSQPPFFCVHAIGGEVLNFVDLATHLGTEQPFYGLQAPTLAEANGAEESIKEMAARYINVICEAFPEGPYLLGGLCYGGTIAFEMARQLRALGKEVALLALIDSWSPAVLPSPQDDAERFVEQALYLARINGKTLDLTPSMLQSLSPDEQLELMLARVKEAGLLPPEIELDWLRRYIRGYKERSHAFRQYTPEGYAGPVTLFRPRQRDLAQMESFEARGLDMQDVAQGWSAATQGVVNTIIVPGYHETMCHEPHVQTLAAELNHCIQDALMMPLEASTYLN